LRNSARKTTGKCGIDKVLVPNPPKKRKRWKKKKSKDEYKKNSFGSCLELFYPG
jgi:hypothetical protein